MLSEYYLVPGALLLVIALCSGMAAVLVTREVVKANAALGGAHHHSQPQEQAPQAE